MDKNTITGFVLIGVVLFAFSWFNRPTPEQIEAQRRYQDSLAQIELAQQMELAQKEQQAAMLQDSINNLPDSVRMQNMRQRFGDFAQAMTGEERQTTIENEVLELRVSNKGGRIVYARLKEYDDYQGQPLVLFDEQNSELNFSLVTADNRVVNTSELYFTPVQQGKEGLTMRLAVGEAGYLDFVYTLTPNDYRVGFSIKGTGLNGLLSPNTRALDMVWTQDIRQQEKGRSFEERYVSLNYKVVADDVDRLSETRDDSKQFTNRLRWIGFKDMFFSSVLIAKGEGFAESTLDSKMIAAGNVLKHFKASTSVPFDLQGREATELTYFFGPNKFALLKELDEGEPEGAEWELEKLVPLGWGIFRWVNQYFVIPLFDFLGSFISNYGLLIFLLTVIVKLILFPLTYKSYISSAKMRVLRPQVEEINAKYPGQEQALERQKATMELYSRAGASPMSGCLPMLLQMPILIALFMFFPSAIELRHQSFLWANDLS
ncbi:MAG: membrane protein insertase YidC, partial [Parabacteroides sp.]|nr:membrane protein insertase YidC [Parabacteroides sp.]